MKVRTGVYAIVNFKDDVKYIGSSKNVVKRLDTHKYLLRHQKHFNKKLQEDWNSLGEGFFSFKLIEEIADFSDLQERERYFIEEFKKSNVLYNLELPETKTKEKVIHENTGDKISIGIKQWRKDNPERLKEIASNLGTKIIAETVNVCHILNSIKEASEFLQLPYNKIQEVLAGKRSMGKGVFKNVYQLKGWKFYYYDQKIQEHSSEGFENFS